MAARAMFRSGGTAGGAGARAGGGAAVDGESPGPSIFCDGACKNNGRRGAVAGWAWAYWPGIARGEPLRFGSAPLEGPVATNQRAELTALLEALQWWRDVGGGGPVTVYTDSQYAINCTSKWGPAWKRKGWRRDSGEPLMNLDLIQPLVDIWRPQWRLVHVYGHQSGGGPEAWGNNWVDRAAVAASEGDGEMFVVAPSDIIEHVSAADMEIPPPVMSTRRIVALAPQMATKQSDIRYWFGGGSV